MKKILTLSLFLSATTTFSMDENEKSINILDSSDDSLEMPQLEKSLRKNEEETKNDRFSQSFSDLNQSSIKIEEKSTETTPNPLSQFIDKKPSIIDEEESVSHLLDNNEKSTENNNTILTPLEVFKNSTKEERANTIKELMKNKEEIQENIKEQERKIEEHKKNINERKKKLGNDCFKLSEMLNFQMENKEGIPCGQKDCTKHAFEAELELSAKLGNKDAQQKIKEINNKNFEDSVEKLMNMMFFSQLFNSNNENQKKDNTPTQENTNNTNNTKKYKFLNLSDLFNIRNSNDFEKKYKEEKK